MLTYNYYQKLICLDELTPHTIQTSGPSCINSSVQRKGNKEHGSQRVNKVTKVVKKTCYLF